MEKFPLVQPEVILSAPYQLELPFDEYPQGQPPQTEMTMQRTIDALQMDVFRVKHEFVLKRPGRAYNVEFSEYISIEHFPAFYDRARKMLLLKTKKDVATSAMHALIRNKDIVGKRRHILLDSIKQHIENFKGAWFKVEDSANVSSQALFGSNINLDARFERASSEGEMINIRLDYPFQIEGSAEQELIHVGIGNDNTIVVYDTNLDEQLELMLVLDVKKHLVDIATEKT